MEYMFMEEVKAAKSGNQEAMSYILSKLKPLLLSKISQYNLIRDMEDMLSEGNLTILKCIRQYDENTGVPFLGYVKSNINFLYLGFAKGASPILSLNESIGLDGDDELISLIKDEGAGVEDIVIINQDYNSLKIALSTLSDRQAQIIKLYFFSNSSMVDIAKDLRLHYQTVVKLKDRALNNLKKSLQPYGK